MSSWPGAAVHGPQPEFWLASYAKQPAKAVASSKPTVSSTAPSTDEHARHPAAQSTLPFETCPDHEPAHAAMSGNACTSDSPSRVPSAQPGSVVVVEVLVDVVVVDDVLVLVVEVVLVDVVVVVELDVVVVVELEVEVVEEVDVLVVVVLDVLVVVDTSDDVVVVVVEVVVVGAASTST